MATFIVCSGERLRNRQSCGLVPRQDRTVYILRLNCSEAHDVARSWFCKSAWRRTACCALIHRRMDRIQRCRRRAIQRTDEQIQHPADEGERGVYGLHSRLASEPRGPRCMPKLASVTRSRHIAVPRNASSTSHCRGPFPYRRIRIRYGFFETRDLWFRKK